MEAKIKLMSLWRASKWLSRVTVFIANGRYSKLNKLCMAALDQEVPCGLISQLAIQKGKRFTTLQYLCLDEHLFSELSGLDVTDVHVHRYSITEILITSQSQC